MSETVSTLCLFIGLRAMDNNSLPNKYDGLSHRLEGIMHHVNFLHFDNGDSRATC